MIEGIAVFGSSEPPPGDPEYDRARRIGSLLAREGVPVVCGGYGGVMEGASRGAREAGGTAIGVGCALFASRRPNPYLSEFIEEPDLPARTARLVALARGFIILPGKSGTLAEVAYLWALRRAGLAKGKPVVLLGDPWPDVLDRLAAAGVLEADSLRETVLARNENEAVSKALAGSGGPQETP